MVICCGAKVDGVVYKSVSSEVSAAPSFDHFCYRDGQGRECFAQVLNFLLVGGKKYVLSAPVKLGASTFVDVEHKVVVDHVRKAVFGGGKMVLPVQKIKKPLIPAGEYFCIPPSANMALYFKAG
jgi:hypothetical protein